MRIVHDLQEQLIKKSLNALTTHTPNQRNVSSVVLRFRRSDMENADRFLRRIRREFSDEFEQGGEHDSVYSLNIQFTRLDCDLG